MTTYVITIKTEIFNGPMEQSFWSILGLETCLSDGCEIGSTWTSKIIRKSLDMNEQIVICNET
jgi:hypothetical protein